MDLTDPGSDSAVKGNRGGMGRMGPWSWVVTVGVGLATVLGVAQAQGPVLTGDLADRAVERGNKLRLEKSWALALREYEKVLPREDKEWSRSREETVRQALVHSGVCQLQLRQLQEGAQKLRAVAGDDGLGGEVKDDAIAPADRWTAEALRVLVTGSQGTQEQAQQSFYSGPDENYGEDTMKAWVARAVRLDGLLETLSPKPDWAQEFRIRALGVLPTAQGHAFVQKHPGLIRMYDRAVAGAGPDQEMLAELALIRTMGHGVFGTGSRPDADFLKELNSIAAEFPGTKAGGEALLQLLRQAQIRLDYPEALEYARQIQKDFRKTPALKEAVRIEEALLKPEATLAHETLADPETTVGILITHRNVESLQLKVESFDLVQQFRTTRRPDLSFGSLTGRTFLRREMTVQPPSDLKTTGTTVDLGVLPRGAYILELSGRGDRGSIQVVRRPILVTGTALVWRSTTEGPALWVVDRFTGKPRTGAKVILGRELEYINPTFGSSYNRHKRLDEAQTDGQGLALEWPRNSNGGYSEQQSAVAESNGDLAIAGNMYFYWAGPSSTDGRKAYVYFDRPAARPGQTVNWRAIVREEKAGRWESPGTKNFQITLRDAKGEEVTAGGGAKTGTDLGTVSGSFEVPLGAPLGRWSLFVADKDSGQTVGSESIQIEEYRKPEYEVSVSLGDGTQAVLGKKVQGQVSARFYRGDAVSGGKVTWTVKRRQTFVSTARFDQDPDLGWFDQEQEGVDPNSRVNSGGDIVAHGQGELDKDGNLKIEFQADSPTGWVRPNYGGGFSPYSPRGRGHWGWWWGEPAFEFQVEATVVDAARRSIDGGAKLTIGDRAMEWALSPERTLLEPGDRARLKVSAFRLDGQRLATQGTLTVERRVYQPKLADDKITTVGTLQVQTKTDGAQWMDFTIPGGRDQAGRWRFVLQGQDQFGQPVTSYREVVVADPATENVFLRNEGIQLMVERRILGPDDRARVLVDAAEPGSTVLLEVLAGNRVLKREILMMDGRSRLLTLPVEEGWTPNVRISATTVRNNQIHTETQEILVPPVRQVLKVSMNTDRDRYQPGQKARVRIEARDSEGEPVDAEFSLSAFDASLTYIAPDAREDVRKFFYGKRRPSSQENPQFSPMLGLQFGQEAPGLTEFYFASSNELYTKSEMRQDGPMGSARMNGRRLRAQAGAMADGIAMPAAAPAAMAMEASSASNLSMARKEAQSSDRDGEADLGTVSQTQAPKVRSDFRDVAVWLATLRTGQEGVVTAEVPLPDSLTRWSLVAVGADGGSRVGNQTTGTVVTKDLIARLEPPRFLVERDELSLAAIVQSNLPTTETVELVIEAKGPLALLGGSDRGQGPGTKPRVLHRSAVQVGPGAPLRVDVPVVAGSPGEARVTLSARIVGGAHAQTGDALERIIPVIEYGAMQYLTWGGSLDQGTTTARGWTLEQAVKLPAGTARGTTRVRVEVQPTLLRAIRDGLPYLVEYPYGCVEQTVSRFAPAAAVMGVAQKLNLPTDPMLAKKLPEALRIGVERLGQMQRGDGGWGWWSGDSDNPYMTAYVAYSLTMARDAEAAIPQDMLDRALNRISADLGRKRDQDREERRWYYGWNNSLHTEALQALVLSLNNRTVPAEAVERLWTLRGELRPHGLAMLTRVLWRQGRQADAEVALRNLANFAVVNEELNTMHWGDRDRGWYWWDDAVESTAMGLQAYLDMAPNSLEAKRAMSWLVMNRRGSRWKSTKDSAAAIFALTRWVLERKEGANPADFTVEILDQSNGKTVATRRFPVKPENLWTGEFHLELTGDAIPESGNLLVRVAQEGQAPGYFGVTAEFLNRSDKIDAAGRELKVTRSYHRVVRVAPEDPAAVAAAAEAEAPSRARRGLRPQPTPAKPDATVVAQEKLEPLRDGDILKPGDMVEVTLNLETSNDFDYLLIEDPKAATFEPTNVQSGSTYADGLCSNVELRDQYVAFFITLLREGKHTLKYRVRTESVGVFRALPSQGSSMYVPELRANSASGRVEVRE